MSGSEPSTPQPWDRLRPAIVALAIPALLGAQGMLSPLEASPASSTRNALLLVPLVTIAVIAVPAARGSLTPQPLRTEALVLGAAQAITLCLGVGLAATILTESDAMADRDGVPEAFGIVGVAIAEELVFRAAIPVVLAAWLGLRWRHWLPATASVVLYVAFHLPSTVSAAVYFAAVGILLARVMHDSGIVVAIAGHVGFNAIIFAAGGLNVDDPRVVVVLLACLAPTLLVPRPKRPIPAQATAPPRAGRSTALDRLRGIAILLIVVENLTLYDWGVSLHAWPLVAAWLDIFEHLGLTLFVAALGASLVLSAGRHGPGASAWRYRRLLRLGVLDALLLFALDVLAQLALIGLLAERALRMRTWIPIAFGVASAITLVVATELIVFGSGSATWGPTMLPLQPGEHALDAVASFGANLVTAPLYLGITVLAAVCTLRTPSRSADRTAVGLALLVVAVALGTIDAFAPLPGLVDETLSALRHGTMIAGVVLLVAAAARRRPGPSRWRSAGALAPLGRSTLSAYLLAGLVMVVVAARRPPGVTGAIAIGIGILLAVLAAPTAARSPHGFEAYVRGR